MIGGLDLIRTEVERTGSIQAVADALGYSRTAISLALDGRYKGSTARIEARAHERLGRVHCPHQRQEIPLPTCQRLREAEMPTASPAAWRQWQACLTCPNNRSTDEVSP